MSKNELKNFNLILNKENLKHNKNAKLINDKLKKYTGKIFK